MRNTLEASRLDGGVMALFHQLVHLVLSFFSAHELAAIFSLLTIEEAGIPIPIPGDTLLILAGARHPHTALYVASILAASTSAVFCGSSILYWIMRRNGRVLMTRYGRFIRLKPAHLERMERWFARRGRIAIILGRLIPGLRMPTTIMAGLSDVPYRVFAPTALLAAVIWSALYFWLGVLITRGLHLVLGFIAGLPDTVSDTLLLWLWVVAGLAVLAGIVGGALHLRRRVRRASRPASQHMP